MKKSGRVVVITGVSSGIGLKLKEFFEKNGDKVVGLTRNPALNAQNVLKCDVTDQAQVKAAFDEIGAMYGHVDILVNNAGLGVSGATELIDAESAEQVMDTNYEGAFFVSRAALKFMGRGSKIVNISSACALFALPFRTVYCASKAALNMLSFGMRMELSQTGIDVVSICPGDVKSNFTVNRIKSKEAGDRYGARVEKAAYKVDSREEKRMNLDSASKKIFKIASNKKGAMYIVGGKYKFLYFASRVLPQGLFLKLTDKMFGGR